MASRRKSSTYPHGVTWDWRPWAIGAAVVVLLGIIVYSCSGVARAQPANKWDLYRWIWPAPPPPPVQPPVVAPVPRPEPPSIFNPPDPPVVAPPPPPVVVAPPPVIVAPPVVIPQPPAAPRPTFKEKAKRQKIEQKNAPTIKPPKPKQPKQKAETETNEYLPPCALVCWYAQGKTRAQLEAEAASRHPTQRMRRHALACLAGCRK